VAKIMILFVILKKTCYILQWNLDIVDECCVMCGTLSLNIESAKTQGVKLCYVVS